jgi:hypothetical protein
MTFPTEIMFLSLAVLLLTIYVASADNRNFERIADAIFLAEGGNKTRFPYGVRIWDLERAQWRPSLTPRAECLAIIRRQHDCWAGKDRPGDFINFLARVYCPVTDSDQGQQNWIRNVKHFLARLEK